MADNTLYGQGLVYDENLSNLSLPFGQSTSNYGGDATIWNEQLGDEIEITNVYAVATTSSDANPVYITNNNNSTSSTTQTCYLWHSGAYGILMKSNGSGYYTTSITLEGKPSDVYSLSVAKGSSTVKNVNGNNDSVYINYTVTPSGGSTTDAPISNIAIYTNTASSYVTATISGRYVEITKNSSLYTFSNKNDVKVGTITIYETGSNGSGNGYTATIDVYIESDYKDVSDATAIITSVTPSSFTLPYGEDIHTYSFTVSGNYYDAQHDVILDTFEDEEASILGFSWGNGGINNNNTINDTSGTVSLQYRSGESYAYSITLAHRPYDSSTTFDSFSVEPYIVTNWTSGQTFTISTSDDLEGSYTTKNWYKFTGTSTWVENGTDTHDVTAHLTSTYTKSNPTSDFTATATAQATCGSYGNQTATLNISVTVSQPPYITVNGETSYSTSLDYQESCNITLPVSTNFDSHGLFWGVIESTGASTVSEYGISVSASGNNVIISGTSLFDGNVGDGTITGNWKVGNVNYYATISVTLGYTPPAPSYSINATSSTDIEFSKSFGSNSATVTFSVTGFTDVVAYEFTETHPGQPDIWDYVTVGTPSVSGTSGSVTISYNGNYTGTTQLSGGFNVGKNGKDYFTVEVDVTVPDIDPVYRWIFDSLSFNDLSCEIGETISSGTSVSGTYIEKRQVSYDNESTWVFIDGSTQSHSVTGSTSASFTGTSTSGGTIQASATCGSYGSKSANVDVNVSNPYTLVISTSLNNVSYNDQANVSSSDFTVAIKKNGSIVSGYSNVSSSCTWSIYSDPGGNLINDFGDQNTLDENITVYFTASYTYTVNSVNIPLSDNTSLTYLSGGDPWVYKTEFVSFDGFGTISDSTTSSSYTISNGTAVTAYYTTQDYKKRQSEPDSSYVTYGSPDSNTTTGYTTESKTVTSSNSTGTIAASVTLPNSYGTYTGNANYSISFNTPQQDYISVDNSSTYSDSIDYQETVNDTLSVSTNMSSWSVTTSTGASTISSYGISVSKSGSSVKITGTSTYNGNSEITGTWRVGNSSTYSTISITLNRYVSPSTKTISFRSNNSTSVNYDSRISLYYDITPDNSDITYSITSGSSLARIVSHYKYSQYLILKNESESYVNQTATVKIVHGSDSTVYDTTDITLYPKPFSIKIDYWYDRPHSYSGVGEGEISVYGAPNEPFALTLTNESYSQFTYGFRTGSYGNYTYTTTYSGYLNSNGYAEVSVYEYTYNENRDDDGTGAEVSATGGTASRTGYCTVRRTYYPPHWTVSANPTEFNSDGGTVYLSCSAAGEDYTNDYKVTSISDNSGMLSGISVDDINKYSFTVLSNPSVSSRQATITFNNYNGNGGNSSVTIKQSGRTAVSSISLSPATLTFDPEVYGDQYKQHVTVISSDYSWSLQSMSGAWWSCTYDNANSTHNSGDGFYVTPTVASSTPDETISATITVVSNGGTTATLTIYQTGDSRKMYIAGTADASGNVISDSSGNADGTNFTGLESWSFDKSTNTLTINMYAEANNGPIGGGTASVSVFKVISKFIGWDMTCLADPVPNWLTVSPMIVGLQNAATTPVTLTAQPWTYEIDASCYDKPRQTSFIITSNLKSNS